MIPDIQPYGVLHIGVDNYFSVGSKTSDESAINNSFPTDVRITIGVLPFEKLQMEIGVDYLQPSDYPVYFNAKIGVPENALFKWFPALQIGIFNVGTKRNEEGQQNGTDQNIVYGVIGKTIPYLGRLAGPYIGNSAVLRSSAGTCRIKVSWLLLIVVSFRQKTREAMSSTGLSLRQTMPGKNAIGGGGFGLYYYFTKDISLLTGPVWFNDTGVNGRWKWSIQLDINVPVFDKWLK